ncbi:hypothetical protein Q8F55_000017 [Vanrija albida]|uniref:F-box domain-containing protein n=1 Tax=Vanrija albida TaxID=181172 RepID=A0ABR3QC36_9TREE
MSTTAAIDHTSFPYLIDMIVTYADIPALVALRAASSAFRQRVDDVLLKHVVITNRKPGGPSGSGTPSYTFKTPLGSLFGVDDHPLPLAPRSVQVADIRYYPGRGECMSPALGSYKSVNTIRRSGSMVSQRGTNYFHGATTVVDFFNMTQETYVRKSKTGKSIIYLPHATQRYVLHLKWREDAPHGLYNDIDFKSIGCIKEWVIVFHPHPSCHIQSFVAAPPSIRAILHEIAKIVTITRASVLMVGAEAIHPCQLGGARHGEGEEDSIDLLHERFDLCLGAKLFNSPNKLSYSPKF